MALHLTDELNEKNQQMEIAQIHEQIKKNTIDK